MLFEKKNTRSEITINLNGTKIDTTDEIKFLGLRLDRNLNFKNQLVHIKNVCRDRLNIIKVLSSSRWKLKRKTVTEVYHSLIRSVMEYTAFIYPLISETDRASLDAIQNDALRIIWNMDKREGNIDLYERSREVKLATRLKNLQEKYISKALLSKNPIITKLRSEYLDFRGGRELAYKTVLCDADIDDSIYDTTIDM